MLAAAGGPDTHPHAVSPPEDRARWDRDVARFDTDLRSVESLLRDIVDGRIDANTAEQRAMEFFGIQGPWYTVGYTMAVAVERCFGRATLVAAMRRPWTTLGLYNRARAACPTRTGTARDLGPRPRPVPRRRHPVTPPSSSPSTPPPRDHPRPVPRRRHPVTGEPAPIPYAPRVPYTALLLDLDHTLLDSDASEACAFDYALASAGVADPARYLPAYQDINLALWRQVERGELAPEHLRSARFARLVDTTGIAASSAALADAFAHGLGAFGELYPGARELLDALATLPNISLALVTNGISDIVRTRLARLDLARYFRTIAISSELGAAKPAPAIFEAALAGLGSPPKPSALMVGDNLASDIQGGRNAGIATCWYNPHRRTAAAGLVDHEIATHDALLALIGA